MSKDLREDIFEQIKKSGYIMEQEVAELLQSLGYDIYTNYPYEDLDTQKSREIDVIASKRVDVNLEHKMSIQISLICECKNNSGALAFIGKQKQQKDTEFVFNDYQLPGMSCALQNEDGTWVHNGKDMLQHLKLYDKHYYAKQPYKSSTFAAFSGNDKKVVLDADRSESVFQKHVLTPIKALVDLKNKNLPLDTEYQKVARFYFPIVILNGDIFYLDYKAKSKDDLTQVQDLSMIHNLVINSQNKCFKIDFVQKKHLQSFIEDKIEPYARYISRVIMKYPFCFVNPQVERHDFYDLEMYAKVRSPLYPK
jgi:hypothetical protein